MRGSQSGGFVNANCMYSETPLEPEPKAPAAADVCSVCKASGATKWCSRCKNRAIRCAVSAFGSAEVADPATGTAHAIAK